MCDTKRYDHLPLPFNLRPKGAKPFQIPTHLDAASRRPQRFKGYDRQALVDTLKKTWKNEPLESRRTPLFIEVPVPPGFELKENRLSGSSTLLTAGPPPQVLYSPFPIRVDGPFNEHKARECLNYLGMEYITESYINFRIRKKKSKARENKWESFLRFADRFTGLKVREALPDENSKLHWDKYLELKKMINWDQVCLPDKLIAAAMHAVFGGPGDNPRKFEEFIRRERKRRPLS